MAQILQKLRFHLSHLIKSYDKLLRVKGICAVKGGICKGQLQTVTACRNEDGSYYNCLLYSVVNVCVYVYKSKCVCVYIYVCVYLFVFFLLLPLSINFT